MLETLDKVRTDMDLIDVITKEIESSIHDYGSNPEIANRVHKIANRFTLLSNALKAPKGDIHV